MAVLAAPRALKPYARALRFGFKSFIRLFGTGQTRQCPVCGHEGRFFSYGYPLVADVLCPGCLSLERHRALALFNKEKNIFLGKSILHFAPEPGIKKLILSEKPKSYTTCDLFAKDTDLRINIEAIDIEDESFDLVLCLHVLEHVDDRKALKELRRILRPGGEAILMVPLEEGWDRTYENPAILSREQRLLHFGQEDHVRYYGRDFVERIEEAGFTVESWVCREPDVLKYGLKRGEKVFLAKRV